MSSSTRRTPPATTCQICGRTIGVDVDGKIARHGYQRPPRRGSGHQTGGCPGSRALPYEASRDVLRRHVDDLEREIEHAYADADGTLQTLVLQVDEVHETKRARTPVMVTVTQTNLAEVIAQYPDFAAYNGVDGRPMTWHELDSRYRAARRADAHQLERERDAQRVRLNATP